MNHRKLRACLSSSLTALALLFAASANATGNQEPFVAHFDELQKHLQTQKKPLAAFKARSAVRLKAAANTAATPADRWAMPLPNDAYGDSASIIRYLDQGWTPDQSLSYYFTDQGSQFFDYDLFVNIEQSAAPALFKEPTYLATFRYLPQKPSPQNPDGLPVGFLKRNASGHNYLSLTCGACHTSQINYQGTGIRIDGAGAQADFVTFLEAVRQAFTANLNDADKFSRLATRILGSHPKDRDVKALKTRLTANRDALDAYFKVNQTSLRDGFARVDAVGRIYNQVLRAVHASKFLSPDAPVSYPFLWDASHHDYVQWPGLTPNAGPGALGRNAGEVVGVFGAVTVTKQTSKLQKLLGYQSSVQADNLVDYEQWLWQLKSPQWPQDLLPKIDTARAAQGKQIYLNQCVSCHRLTDRDDSKRLVYAQMYGLDVVGTDSRELTNALQSGDTGILEGALTGITSNDKYGPTAPVVVMLADVVSGTLLRNVGAALKATEDAKNWGLGIVGPAKQGQYPTDPNNPFASLAAYKARPLDGIWATAPYLHNGAVPTLYDLLLPASQRPARFAVGQLEFDPVKVGHKSDPNDPLAPYIFDTSLAGNSNQGHEFGTNSLNDEQRWQLLEYLKTL
jgi:cytochrome c